ncbi:hypothetical protein E3Q24_03566 [Wallemia mellicola]|nr:hypothetical protein E3Q24_03566 [Wallemia mellicola]
MTSKAYEIWSEGPSVESLFGKDFPLARDHIDWEQLEKDNDQWVIEKWPFQEEDVKEYLLSSNLGNFSTMCEYKFTCHRFAQSALGFPFGDRERTLWAARFVTLLFCLDEDLDRNQKLHLLPILKGLVEGSKIFQGAGPLNKPQEPDPSDRAELAIAEAWGNIKRTSDPNTFQQLVRLTVDYFNAHGNIHYENYDQYVATRRRNVGAYFMWGYGRYTLGINLSDAQLEHPLIKELEDVAGPFVNDYMSYTKEYLTDTASNNILTLLQVNDKFTKEEAIKKIVNDIDRCEVRYVEIAKKVFEDDELSKSEDATKFTLNVPYALSGNAWWSQVTRRYDVDPNNPIPFRKINIDRNQGYHPFAIKFVTQPTHNKLEEVKTDAVNTALAIPV